MSSIAHPIAPADLQRRRLCLGLPALALGGMLGGCASGPTTGAEPAVTAAPGAVVPFSSAAADGSLPRGWAPYVMRRDLPRTRYQTCHQDGKTVLHAQGTGTSSGLQCQVSVDPVQTPWLRWQWRVNEMDARATIDDEDLSDTPTRIIIGFEGDLSRLSFRDRLIFEQVELFTGHKLPFATLMYVWDGQLPVEHVRQHERTGRVRYLVAESGQTQLRQWLAVERNVMADYERVFGEAPGRISSVGVLTDSDDLKSPTEAWYGDIGFFGRPASA